METGLQNHKKTTKNQFFLLNPNLKLKKSVKEAKIKNSKFRQLEDLYFAPNYLCIKFREDLLKTVGGDSFLRQNEVPITTASLVIPAKLKKGKFMSLKGQKRNFVSTYRRYFF